MVQSAILDFRFSCFFFTGLNTEKTKEITPMKNKKKFLISSDCAFVTKV